jgi:hypothetical protein
MGGGVDGWRSRWVEEWRSRWVEEWRSGGVEEWRSGGVDGLRRERFSRTVEERHGRDFLVMAVDR